MGQKETLWRKFIQKADESDIEKIDENLDGMKRGKIEQVWNQVQSLYQMIKDPKAAWKSKAVAIGALIYLISPLDAVPDLIPGVGLADDAAIIVGTVALLGQELKKYMRSLAEEMAEVEVQKHSQKLRITLITLICCGMLAIGVKFFTEDLWNLFTVYRVVLLILTGVETVWVLTRYSKFKRLYEKLPSGIKKYLRLQSLHLINMKMKESRKELVINSLLLVLLFSLNIIAWMI